MATGNGKVDVAALLRSFKPAPAAERLPGLHAAEVAEGSRGGPAVVNPEERRHAAERAAAAEREQQCIVPVDERGLCRICMVEPRRVLWTACGHFIACSSCSDRIVAKNAKCPMCSTLILPLAGLRLIDDSPLSALGGAQSFMPEAVDASAAAAAVAAASPALVEDEGEGDELVEEEEEEEAAPEMLMHAALLAEAADAETRLEQTRTIRILLSRNRAPPLRAAIQAGVLPQVVGFLGAESTQLQLEAAWVLTNITASASACVRAVIDAGALPPLLTLLRSPDGEVCAQSAWCLGNIAGDCSRYRDAVIAAGAVTELVALSERELPLSTMRTLAWCASNCTRRKPQPALRDIEAFFPMLSRYILSDDAEVLADVCWATAYISDGPNNRIQAVADSGLLERLVELLSHESDAVTNASLRGLANVVSGNETQTQAAVDAGLLPALHRLLTRVAVRDTTLKEACWAVSNVTAGTQAQIQAVLDAGIIPVLVERMAIASQEVVNECVWALSNASQGGSTPQVRFSVEQGCIPPLCDALASPSLRVVAAALAGLETILRIGREDADEEGEDAANRHATLVTVAGGLDKLEALRRTPSEDVSEHAARLMETFFDEYL